MVYYLVLQTNLLKLKLQKVGTIKMFDFPLNLAKPIL